MTKCDSLLQDLSLISDLSETSDINDFNVVNCVTRCDQSSCTSSTSPLVSEASSYSAKQVRFNSAICISALAGEITENDLTLGEDFTWVTPSRSLSNSLTCMTECDPTNTLTCSTYGNNVTPAVIPNSKDEDSLSKHYCYQNGAADRIVSNRATTFFCTADHIPRLPLAVHSPTVEPFTSNSSTGGGEASCRDRDVPDFVPRPQPAPCPRDCGATTRGLAAPSSNNDYLDLAEPKHHTTALLAEELAELSKCIEKESLQAPSEAMRREAARFLSEAYNSSNRTEASACTPLYLNSALTVNIPEHVETFNNLLNLSVDESEIVRLERQRVAAQRKRMAELRRQAASNKSEGPEPDLLEFFDPNRHIFQSANLHLAGLPRLLPSLCRADETYSHTVFNRVLSDFARL